MNTKIRFFPILTVVSILIASCGAAPSTQAPATQPPAATQAQAAQSVQITDLVAILVVDTFLKSDANQTNETNCSITPGGLGQQYGGKVASATFLGDAHGKFVYSDVINMIRNYGNFIDPPITEGRDFKGASSFVSLNYSFIKRAELYLNKGNAGQGLLVMAVDTDGLNFDSIFNNIPTTIDLLSNNNVQFGEYSLPTTNRFVVNMSFVFVPCQPMQYISSLLSEFNEKYLLNLSPDDLGDLEVLGKTYDNHDGNFYKYVNCMGFNTGDCLHGPVNLRSQLQALNDNYDKVKPILESEQIFAISPLTPEELDDAVFNAFIVDLIYSSADKSWVDSLAPLRDKLESYSNVVYIAAAGNFGYPYPYTPASWSFVYSLSSTPSEQTSPPDHPEVQPVDNGLSLAKYSNWGEVQLDGDYWAVPDDIYGTSFAAPKFSFWAAWSLFGYDICPRNAALLPNGLTNLNNPTGAPPWNNFDYKNNCLP